MSNNNNINHNNPALITYYLSVNILLSKLVGPSYALTLIHA